MSQIDNKIYTAHQQVWMLLPWYGNQSIDGHQRCLVKDHVQICLACRTELAKLAKLSDHVCAPSMIEIATGTSYIHLRNRIRKAKICRSARGPIPSLSHRIRAYFPELVGRLKFGLPAALVFVSLCIHLSVPLFSHSLDTPSENYPAEFLTLATPSDTDVSGRDIHVVFTDGIGQKQRDKIIESIYGQVVEGPNANGVYRVRVGNQQTTFRKVVAAISALRLRADVIFAEPAFRLTTAIE